MATDESEVNRSVTKVSGFTGLSRILGLAREVLTSRLVGASLEQSAFVFAFTIPNLFRKLFGEGALSSAFVPVFKAQVEQARLEEAERLAKAVASMVFLLLAALCAVGMVVLSVLLPMFEPGGRVAVTMRLTRTMLPYAVMICTAAFGMGILNAFGRFGRAAFAPAILNIVWIATLVGLFFFPELSLYRRVSIVSWAVLLAGLLQMVFLLSSVRRTGIRVGLTFEGWFDREVRVVWRNTFIGALGMGAVQINLVLDNALALWAAPWAPAAISYAERLVYLPLGVVATAFATVLLPTLAGAFARNEVEEAKGTLRRSAEDVLLLTLPAGLGLALLSQDIVAVVYQGGAFTPEDTVHVSRALMCYAPGLLVFSLNKILNPWFYAQQDMKTPLKVAVVMVGANLVLNVALVLTLPVGWKHAGIAGSTVFCSLVASFILAWKARASHGLMGFGRLVRPLIRMGLAAVLMGAVVLGARTVGIHYLGEGRLAAIAVLGFSILAGMLVYGIVVWRLCPDSVRRILMRRARRSVAKAG